MATGPLPTDLRIQVPRRSMAAWYRLAKQFEPLLQNVGVEANPANLLAAMLEVLDGLKNPNRIPSADPNSPIEEWPDGRGVTSSQAGGLAGGLILVNHQTRAAHSDSTGTDQARRVKR